MLELATLTYNDAQHAFVFKNHRLGVKKITYHEEIDIETYLNRLSLENWDIKPNGVGAFLLQRKEFPNPIYNRLAWEIWQEYTDGFNVNILKQPVFRAWVKLSDLISFQLNLYVNAAEDIRQAGDNTLINLLTDSTPRILIFSDHPPLLWDGNHRMNEALNRGFQELYMPCVDMENLVKLLPEVITMPL